MKVAVTGSSGFIGSALVPVLASAGHEVIRLKRGEVQPADATVHLAGESLASGRWTADKKRRIRDSRIQGTRTIAAAATGVLVSASAIGYYGDRGDEVLTEESAPGRGFLAELCRDWENAAAEAHARVVRLRFGVLLSSRGGALAKMLPAFRVGAGGPIGSGRQYVSWIALEDAVRAVLFALEHLQGPVNAVAPNPVTSAEFARSLGRVLGRPAVVPAPAFALRLAFGAEMVNEVLLASQRVLPKRLLDAGFAFRYPSLEEALRSLH